ncbi:MAG: hypothetical protein JWR18_1790 [Segetibacter sp.]|nr:hypothetical protein [Segetibacter sp.]
MDEVLKELSGTERNFKLAKEESLMNLEKAKIEQKTDASLIEGIRDLLSKVAENGKQGVIK